MIGLVHELRQAVRTATRLRVFALLSVVTLALGVGATSGLFAVIDAVLLAPIVPEQSRVVRIWKHDPQRNAERVSLSFHEFQELRRATHTLDALAAIMYADTGQAVLANDGRPVLASIAPVSSNWFAVLTGRSPLYGRWLDPSDDESRDELAAVVSHRFWQRASGGDAGFVGRRLLLGDGKRSLVVVGIAPADVEYPLGADVFVSIPAYFDGREGRFNAQDRRLFHFELAGRMARDVTLTQVRAELDLIAQRIVTAFPGDYRSMPIIVEPLVDSVVGAGRPVLWMLFSAALLVLVVAAVNVAALLLMRAIEQRRETAVRVALGATRGRLARQTIAEATVLGAAALALGLALARLLIAVLQSLAPGDLPRVETARLGWSTTAFAFALVLGWVCALGTVPLWRRPRDAASSLQRAPALNGLRAFSVAQIAVAVVVAIGAGLLVRSFGNLAAIERGFRPANVMVLSLVLPEADFPDARRRLAFFSELVSTLRALPGVFDAAPIHLEPGTGTVGLSAPMLFEGQTREEAARNPHATWEPVLPSFFATMGIAIVRGRAVSDEDTAQTQPVVVVSESMAARYWPGEDPIGKRLRFIPSMPEATVVGVAADVRYRELTRDWMTAYFPGAQFFFFSPRVLAVRAVGDVETVMPAVRDVVHRLAPHAAIDTVETMDSLLARDVARPRAALLLAGLFAAIAALLAAVGVYGVVSYEMAQRRREWAVRSAVGASPARIFREVLGRSSAMAVGGAAAGLVLAVAITRFMRTLLYGVEALDVGAFAAGATVLLGAALVAAAIPARRAATTDPVVTLRAE